MGETQMRTLLFITPWIADWGIPILLVSITAIGVILRVIAEVMGLGKESQLEEVK